MLDESEKAWLDDHLNRLHQSLRDLHQKADQLMSDQSHLDTDVQTLTSYFGSIEDEIASLKGQPGAAALDFTGLDALVATVKAAVPAPTTDTAPPADTAPAAPSDPTVGEAAATTDPAVSDVIVPSPDPDTVTDPTLGTTPAP
jgi:peptidoglycan hydrolase CwlO-like protein